MVAYDTLIFFLMYLDCLLSSRKFDEELDAVMLAAQALVYNLKKLNGLNRYVNQDGVDNLQMASLLALFVSDHFGGS